MNKKRSMSVEAVRREQKAIPLWKLNAKGTTLTHSFNFSDFKTALSFVNRVGKEAETLNHHPDIALSYGKVRIALTTHDAGGLTEKDFFLAEAIDGQFKK